MMDNILIVVIILIIVCLGLSLSVIIGTALYKTAEMEKSQTEEVKAETHTEEEYQPPAPPAPTPVVPPAPPVVPEGTGGIKPAPQ